MTLEQRAQTLAGDDGEVTRLSGGDVSQVFRVGERVVKLMAHGAEPGFFAAEARGLARLAGAGAPVPEVHAVHDDGLVLSYHPPGPTDWRTLGRSVAELHRVAAPAYGSEGPVWLGRFRFDAGTESDPTAFLVERRLRPLLEASRTTLGPARQDRVQRFVDGITVPAEGPREVHGDLWAGNVLHTTSGPRLIDPSAQGAERAYDLAMMRLFGGFPDEFWRAYQATFPVSEAARQAIPAHQLVFVLVHVVMFGASYLDAVDRIIEE